MGPPGASTGLSPCLRVLSCTPSQTNQTEGPLLANHSRNLDVQYLLIAGASDWVALQTNCFGSFAFAASLSMHVACLHVKLRGSWAPKPVFGAAWGLVWPLVSVGCRLFGWRLLSWPWLLAPPVWLASFVLGPCAVSLLSLFVLPGAAFWLAPFALCFFLGPHCVCLLVFLPPPFFVFLSLWN